MAKISKVTGDDEKSLAESVQKRFKNLFSGQHEPPSQLSIQQVEALKARVAELEAELSKQSQSPQQTETPMAEKESASVSSPADLPHRSEPDAPIQPALYHHVTASGWLYEVERHVEERTRDLQRVSEIGRAIGEMTADINILLKQAVELIRERFKLYYTQIYLLDSTGRKLILRAGTGDVGVQLISRGHQLLIGSGSLNGRAASEKHTVIVSDTSHSTSFLPNPLLPKTRSEMAVPLLARGQVVGVLDMQSDQPEGLNETNLPAFEALAGQLAVTIQNASLFAQAEEARAEVEAQVGRVTEQGWQNFLNAIERGQKMGFAFDQNRVTPLEEDALTPLPAEQALSVPVNVTGAKVGMIQVANEPDRAWTVREAEVLDAAAAQLSQHIENLRLLAQAEKYRAEAEDAVRRLTREGWDTYLQQQGEEITAFAYDLNEVYPLSKEGDEHRHPGISQPLTVRDEVIGEFAVNTDERSEEEANEIVSAVVAQLSAHVENLRLSLSNMRLLKSTEERARREQILRQITGALRSSTNPETIMRTAVRELGNILGRKTIVQMMPPEQSNQAESAGNNGNGSDSTAGSH
jgi:GAF domain-containing protein